MFAENNYNNHSRNYSATSESYVKHGFSLIGWKFNEIAQYLIISLFLLTLIIVKMIHSKIHIISSLIPESFLLLFIGSMFGLVIRFVVHNHLNLILTPEKFFFVLLPPIILDASYGLATRSFAKVIHLVLILSILGTIFNFMLIGCSFELGKYFNLFNSIRFQLNPKICWLFSSIIVAVDPVAVLAIFNDIGVKPELYFTLFGESLINDGVTVVLYEFIRYITSNTNAGFTYYLMGISCFFTVSFGGLLIGSTLGIISCFITRLQTTYEVIILMILGYLSYILADLLKWSGIISIMFCGLIQACYAFHNITSESLLVLRKIVSFWCTMSEGVIFLFLGEKLVFINIGWNSKFICWTTFTCIGTRFIVIFTLFAIFQLFSSTKDILNFKEQIILSYSGLRGAVAFSLVVLLAENEIGKDTYDLLVSTILFLILFSIGFQGLSMKLLIRLLKINKISSDELHLFKTANEFAIDHTLSCIEVICGEIGQNAFREWWINLNDRKIKPILQCYPLNADEKILTVMEKLSLTYHLKNINSTMIRSNATNNNFDKCYNESHSTDETLENLLKEKKEFQKICVTMSSSVDKMHKLIMSRRFTSLLENNRETTMIRSRKLNKNPDYLVKEMNRINNVRKCSQNLENRISSLSETEKDTFQNIIQTTL